MIPQFIGAMIAASSLVIGSSFLWPKFSPDPRPPILETVHTKALETDAGKRVEEVLGMTDSLSVSSVSSSVVSTIGKKVQEKSEEVITERFVDEVVRRFPSFSEKEKETLRTAVCVPKE